MGIFGIKESFQNEYKIYSLRGNYGVWSWGENDRIVFIESKYIKMFQCYHQIICNFTAAI